jgi:hypothetical protein
MSTLPVPLDTRWTIFVYKWMGIVDACIRKNPIAFFRVNVQCILPAMIKYVQLCQWTSLTTKTIKVHLFPSITLNGMNHGSGFGKYGDGENHPNVQGVLSGVRKELWAEGATVAHLF